MNRFDDAFLFSVALLVASACEPTESECDGCDGTMKGDDLCVVTLKDLPGAGTDAPDAQVGEPTQWESAPWKNAPWLSLPGGGALKVQHGLGREPVSVQVYLSFEKDDSDREGTRSTFLAAGDLAHISDVNDGTVTIENNTGEDFCLRIVLE